MVASTPESHMIEFLYRSIFKTLLTHRDETDKIMSYEISLLNEKILTIIQLPVYLKILFKYALF